MKEKKKTFPLHYIEWCKKTKNPKSLKDTERFDWICEFYQSDEWNRKEITPLDLIKCMGM